jgi:hypothetical protein
MEVWGLPGREQAFACSSAAAVDGRRHSLGGSTTAATAPCDISVRQAPLKASRGPAVGHAGLHLLNDVRDQSHSDDDDAEPGTENLDDALSLAELQTVSWVLQV